MKSSRILPLAMFAGVSFVGCGPKPPVVPDFMLNPPHEAGRIYGSAEAEKPLRGTSGASRSGSGSRSSLQTFPKRWLKGAAKLRQMPFAFRAKIRRRSDCGARLVLRPLIS